jgi:4-amino-4-deoxy-L-arabinose transferase-like glycosyltransferase
MQKRRIITIAILIFILVLRFLYIANPPFELGDFWRQSDTEAIARNFVENRFNILYPQLNYDGPMPNYAQLELQITPFLIAILYRLFGYHYAFARIVPTIFFMGSTYFIYLTAKRYFSEKTAWLAMIIYGILPINLFYSRAIMPESCGLFFYVGAFYLFSKWLDTEESYHLLLSALFTAAAILEKIPTAFVGIPMIFMAAKKYRQKMLSMPDLWLFGIISLGLPFVYFKWLSSVAEFRFVNGIAYKHIIPRFFSAIFTTEAIRFFVINLPQSFTLYAIVLFIIGFILIDRKKAYPIAVWALVMVLELITIVAVIKFRYYLIFMTPLIAMLAANALMKLNNIKAGGILTGIIILAMIYTSYRTVLPWYCLNNVLIKQAEIIEQTSGKQDLIVIGTFDPGILNASNRKGWRANIKYYEHIPKDIQGEMNYFIKNGARYFVPLKGYIYGDYDGNYKDFLEKNFEKIEQEEGYPIYKLQ